ncbi:MAG: type III secretion system outer membrane ring subunit SctC [Hydrogenophaga sp.]
MAVTLSSALALAPGAHAADWTGKKFVYKAEGKKLAEVFQDFAASQEIPVVVDPGVSGVVNGAFSSTSERFLSAMTRTYGVIWYFDGVTLFVYPSNVMQSRVFRLRGFGRNEVRDTLASFGMGDKRFPLRYNEVQGAVFVHGPPRHIELVQSAIETLEQGFTDRNQSSVRVIPLKYAVAADKVFGTSRVPGLASTLNSAFGRGGRSGAADASVDSVEGQAKAYVDSMSKYDLSMQRGYGASPSAKSQPISPPNAPGRDRKRNRPESETAEPNGDARQPYFQAEEATNSVIITGSPQRIAELEQIVRQLDVPQDMVEIEATIIDVSSDEFESLGIDWDFTRTGRSNVTVNGGSQPIANPNVTTLLSDAGRILLTRIRALEGKGKARIVSRPKVLGSANRVAVMSDKRLASVRVAGNLDANLFSLEAGSMLQVQPQIIPGSSHRDIKLSLFIQDGNFESAGVDQIPIIKRTEISTEAMIREGESLLVGGIVSEEDIQDRTGLPGVSRVPVIGALFRNTEGTRRSSQRMFLITPKVVSARGEATLGQGPAPQGEGGSLANTATPRLSRELTLPEARKDDQVPYSGDVSTEGSAGGPS